MISFITVLFVLSRFLYLSNTPIGSRLSQGSAYILFALVSQVSADCSYTVAFLTPSPEEILTIAPTETATAWTQVYEMAGECTEEYTISPALYINDEIYTTSPLYSELRSSVYGTVSVTWTGVTVATITPQVAFVEVFVNNQANVVGNVWTNEFTIVMPTATPTVVSDPGRDAASHRIALGVGLVVGLGLGIPGLIFMYLTFRAMSKRVEGESIHEAIGAEISSLFRRGRSAKSDSMSLDVF